MALFGNSNNDMNDDLGDFGLQPEENTVPDILQMLNITPTVKIPDTVFVPEDVKRPPFRISQPRGYYPEDVHDYHSKTLRSLEWFKSALETRNKDIVALANRANQIQTDFINVKNQNAWLETKITSDSPYDPEVVAQLQARIQEQQDHINQLISAKAGSLDVGEREELVSLRKWADEVSEKYDELEGHYSTSLTQNELLTNENIRLQNELAEARDGNITLPPEDSDRSRIEALEASLQEERDKNAALASRLSEAESNLALSSQIDPVDHSESAQRIEVLEDHIQSLNDHITTLEKIIEANANVVASNETVQEYPEFTQPTTEENASTVGYGELSDDYVESYDDYSDSDLDDISIDIESDEGEEPENLNEVFTDYQEGNQTPVPTPVEANSGSELVYSTTTTPEEGEDDYDSDPFKKMLAEIRHDADSDAPEIGSGLRRSGNDKGGIGRIAPGAPLTSIPQGADPRDYL